MNRNRPMIVLMATCVSSFLFLTDGLLTSHEQMICRRLLFPIFQSRPLVECHSKTDPSLESDSDEDEDYITKIEGEPETNRLGDGSNDIGFRMNDDRRTNLQDNNLPDPVTPQALSTPTVLFATFLFVSSWPLLALLRSTMSPIDGFDIDMFMALKGILDTSPMDNMDPTIVEFPSLSPAEQLVGAIFGPPQ